MTVPLGILPMLSLIPSQHWRCQACASDSSGSLGEQCFSVASFHAPLPWGDLPWALHYCPSTLKVQ